MNFLRRNAFAMAAGAMLALASGAASADDTNFVGFTNGCYGLNCVPPSTDAATSVVLGGLTFTNSTFDVMSSSGFVSIGDLPGTPNLNNLGSFSLSTMPFTYTGSHFDLLITFTAPPGTTPDSILVKDTITGSVGTTDNGGVFIDLDNSVHHFTFGSGDTAGSFDFFANDVSVTAGGVVAVTGTIVSVVSSVPEPETYALFLAGLGAVGFMARRRKS